MLGIKDELKGEVPCGFIVLKAGVNRPQAEIEKEFVQLVREQIGPVAAFKLAITVARAAEDALGQDPARHDEEDRRREAWTMPATIDDPAMLDEIGAAMKAKGVGAVERRDLSAERARSVASLRNQSDTSNATIQCPP